MDVDEGVHRPVDDVERGGGGGCEACVALARGRVKLIAGVLCLSAQTSQSMADGEVFRDFARVFSSS
jgi:hypothetical protein